LPVTLACATREAEIRGALESLCWGSPEAFSAWLLASTEADLPTFDRAAMQVEMEQIEAFIASYRNGRAASSRQLALL